MAFYFGARLFNKRGCIFVGTLGLVCSLFYVTSVYRQSVVQKNARITAFFQDPKALTIQCNKGRLGNQMGLYSTLYGLSALNNRTAYFPSCNMNHLRKYFRVTGPEVSDIPEHSKRGFKIGSFLRKEDYRIPWNANVLVGYKYPNSFTFFQHVQKGIREEFTFHDNITQYAQRVLRDVRGTKHSVTYIGIHVRRGDYSSWLNDFYGRKVDFEYFAKATQYFRTLYFDSLFVVVSDDRKWCQRTLSNLSVIVAPPSPSPAHDMAILTNCNHTIMTYGTFGFWAAYLTGGDTVYFDDYLMPGTSFLTNILPYNITFLPGWVGISTTKPGFWKNYNNTRH